MIASLGYSHELFEKLLRFSQSIRLLQDHSLRREMSEAVLEVAQQSGLGSQDAMGGRVGDMLLAALKKKLKTVVI